MTFKDNTGLDWFPRLTLRAIVRTASKYDLKLEDIATDPQKLSPSVIGDLLWQSVAGQAAERGVSEDTFLDSLYPPQIADAINAMFTTAFGVEGAVSDSPLPSPAAQGNP
jgi:hypothetical protein